MKVRPLHDWTIIKRHEPKEKTTGGIIIPDTAQDIPTEGTVVAIGPGLYKKESGKKTKFIPTTLKPGQKVYFMEYSTQEIELDGEETIFIREEDILGTLEDDKQLMIKESHPIEAKQEKPLMPHAKAAISSFIAPSKKEASKKKPSSKKKTPAKKKRIKKEQAVSRKHKPSTKTKAKSEKKTTKRKTTKPSKKVTVKKTRKKTAKKSIKRIALKPAKGKKAASKKKSVKGSGKKKR